jgi:hypothetical protein
MYNYLQAKSLVLKNSKLVKYPNYEMSSQYFPCLLLGKMLKVRRITISSQNINNLKGNGK